MNSSLPFTRRSVVRAAAASLLAGGSRRINEFVAELPTGTKRYLESHHWD